MTGPSSHRGPGPAATAQMVSGVIVATIALSAGVAAAQDGAADARSRPGWLALLFGTLMLLTWAAGFGVALHRARTRRPRVDDDERAGSAAP